ncbi:sensor histidine kinase [Flavihumibacter sp. UBA7668]|uniref:sensor histidine kinase n=1 Tax=Flavihumibacter sp. UBA7668 TaxID=1946542 RepID=UPI0025C4CCB0|nr:histidine kinase [Flavihumibacter sp. UBA7668]
MFAHKHRFWLILLLGSYSYLNTLFAEVYTYYKIDAPWYLSLLTMLLVTLAIWETNRLLEVKINKLWANKPTWNRLGIFFLAGTISSIVLALLIISITGKGFTDLSGKAFMLPAKLTTMYATRINLFLHTINALFVFISNLRQKEVEAESLKRISVQAQLQAIRNQINPHFLFNNLNVLSGLLVKDNPDANEFVESFATVYRHILSNQDKELVPLRSELEFIQPYIFLLKKRFPDSLSVSLYVQEADKMKLIVPGALQLLIENAIKHNVLSKQFPLVIDISVNGNNSLVVSNNLQIKAPVEPSTRIGLKNIQQRYELSTGKTITVKQDEKIFSVYLPLIN